MSQPNACLPCVDRAVDVDRLPWARFDTGRHTSAPHPLAPAPHLVKGKYGMTRTLLAVAAFIAATASFAILQKAAAQDVEKGQRSFNKCLPCHAIGPGAENKVGPELNGLDGRQAGTAANFNYSDANKNSGIVWNEATFKDYIRSPQARIPGTKMAFAGITNPQEIEDLWAYLKQFDANGEVKK
jgi:cytochrome c